MNDIPFKHKDHLKYQPLKDFEIEEGVTVGNLVEELKMLRDAYIKLTQELKNAIVIKKDQTYILEIDDELKRIKNPQFLQNVQLEKPIDFYKVQNNKIVLDNKKVGAI